MHSNHMRYLKMHVLKVMLNTLNLKFKNTLTFTYVHLMGSIEIMLLILLIYLSITQTDESLINVRIQIVVH